LIRPAHDDAMTPEAVKPDSLSSTGSDVRSRAVVVMSLLVQLLASRDVRAVDVDAGVHLPLKQALTGEQA